MDEIILFLSISPNFYDYGLSLHLIFECDMGRLFFWFFKNNLIVLICTTKLDYLSFLLKESKERLFLHSLYQSLSLIQNNALLEL